MVFASRAQKGKLSSTNSAWLEMPTRMSQPFESGSLGALDLTTSGETRVITRTDESLLRQMTENIDKTLLSVLACRTAEEFGKVRKEIWETYFRARRALGDTINLVIPKKFIESVRCATLERISEDLERSRTVLFGEEIAQQFEFTMWTVNRIQAVVREIEKAGNPVTGIWTAGCMRISASIRRGGNFIMTAS
jgi:hypothetical protein